METEVQELTALSHSPIQEEAFEEESSRSQEGEPIDHPHGKALLTRRWIRRIRKVRRRR